MFSINSKSEIPIYEQLSSQIKHFIINGHLKAGDKLPSVREMANSLNITPNTVRRAYIELQSKKIIKTLRGKGTFISSKFLPKMEEVKLSLLKSEIKKIVLDLTKLGLDENQILELISTTYNETIDFNNVDPIKGGNC